MSKVVGVVGRLFQSVAWLLFSVAAICAYPLVTAFSGLSRNRSRDSLGRVARLTIAATLMSTLPLVAAAPAAASAPVVNVVVEPDFQQTGETSIITATVVHDGNPVVGAVVTFTVDPGDATVAPPTSTTDANGVATSTVTSANAGTYTIQGQATVPGHGTDSGFDQITFEDPAPDTLTLIPTTGQNTVGEDHTMTATVIDQFGNPVSDTAVFFEAAGTGNETPSSDTGLTNASGNVTYTFTSFSPGESTITATVVETTVSDTATKTWLAGSATFVTLEPLEEQNTVGDPHTVTATVYDEFENRAPGQLVTFTVTGPGATTGNDITDSNGQASFTWTSSEAGWSTTTATAGTATSNAVYKLWTAGAVDQITLTPTTADNTVGEQHLVTATVVDEFGNPVNEADVTFFASGTGEETPASAVRTTDENGQATFSFTSTRSGTSSITATSQGVTSSAVTKNWEADRVTSLQVDATSPQDVGDCFPVTITAYDINGNETTATVEVGSYSISDAGSQLITYSDTGCNSFEETFFVDGSRVIYASSIDVETVIISASDNFNEVYGESAPIAIQSPSRNIVISPSTGTNTVGEAHTVTATVTDEFENPVVQGTIIEWSASGTGEEIPASDQDITDENGVATFTFTSTRAGTTLIEATSGDAYDSASKTWVAGPASSLSLTPEYAQNIIGDPHTVTAFLADSQGNGIPGVTVTFSVAGTGAETPTGGTDVTDQNGEATFSFTSPETGTSDITATALDMVANAVKDWFRHSDYPITGDWDGDGDDTPGVVRGNLWLLRNSNSSGVADISFIYGFPSDTPIVGDWDGDGDDTPGIVRGNVWHLRNSNSEGAANVSFEYGIPDDFFLPGDWDGDGDDTPGVVRVQKWLLRSSNSGGVADHGNFDYGFGTDYPIKGDWDGDGDDTPGVVRDDTRWLLRNTSNEGPAHIEFIYGALGDFPITGDWDGDGDDNPGIVRGNKWYLRTDNSGGGANIGPFEYGEGF